jgi:hypothetical protein
VRGDSTWGDDVRCGAAGDLDIGDDPLVDTPGFHGDGSDEGDSGFARGRDSEFGDINCGPA